VVPLGPAALDAGPDLSHIVVASGRRRAGLDRAGGGLGLDRICYIAGYVAHDRERTAANSGAG
jgi:hypothetical protein